MPKQRITKEMVVDAAFEIARKDGIEKATVKTIAEKLGCSVQPIYSYCKNMDGLKNDVAEKARTFILAEVGKTVDRNDLFRSTGHAYIQIAKNKYFHFCGKAAAPEYADLYHWYRNNLLRHLFLNFRS